MKNPTPSQTAREAFVQKLLAAGYRTYGLERIQDLNRPEAEGRTLIFSRTRHIGDTLLPQPAK